MLSASPRYSTSDHPSTERRATFSTVNVARQSVGIEGVGLEMSFFSLCKECLHFCKGISVYEANVSIVCIELVFVISVF